MSGTDLAHAATRQVLTERVLLRARYAMSGTEVAVFVSYDEDKTFYAELQEVQRSILQGP
eukprot:2527225-Rhodomonas_salina.1